MMFKIKYFYFISFRFMNSVGNISYMNREIFYYKKINQIHDISNIENKMKKGYFGDSDKGVEGVIILNYIYLRKEFYFIRNE